MQLVHAIALSFIFLRTCVGLQWWPWSSTTRQARVSVDMQSCSTLPDQENNLDGAYKVMKRSFHTAIEWAKRALEQIDMAEDERGENDPAKRDAINRKLELLIGATNRRQRNIKTFRKHLAGVASYKVSSLGVGWKEWEESKTLYDVEIYCDTHRIQQVQVDRAALRGISGVKELIGEQGGGDDNQRSNDGTHVTVWMDMRNGLYLRLDNPIVSLAQGTSTDMAVTTWQLMNTLDKYIPGRSVYHKPYGIVFNPVFLEDWRRKGWNLISKSKINHAAVETEHFTKPDHAESPAGLLYTLEVLALHELSHTITGRKTKDYQLGWVNCVRHKQPGNADTVAWFGLVVELILKYGFDIDENGRVVKLDSID